ncbi:MAG: HAD family phosphatase [Synergistaceae bacterium]|nr:HAD family phosphatase [Synergistaceae bacterium]
MIDTVIFDIGNVLAGFDWDGYIRRTLGDGPSLARVNDAIRNHGLWDEFDRGVMDTEEIVEGFIRFAPDCEKEIRLLCATLGDCMRRSDYAIPWLRSVKETGRRVLYLSNYSRIIMKNNPGVLDFMPLMDGGVFSCDVRLLKPDRAIYACLCERYSLSPSRCVFLDDLEANVQGARDFGFHGLRFQSYEQARAELERLL